MTTMLASSLTFFGAALIALRIMFVSAAEGAAGFSPIPDVVIPAAMEKQGLGRRPSR
ncbi:MAG: hypothetical protein ACYCY9_03770 [Thiobacillus sp.]